MSSAGFAPLDATSLPPLSGGKAARLHWLQRHGASVPPALVLPADAVSRLEAMGQHAAASAIAEALGPGPYAVRSSADVEDGQENSFAGQFESVLDVPDATAAVAAIRRVAASTHDERVARYAGRLGIDPEGIRMAVIVQRMVHPAFSGVAFSRNPLTGLDEVVIEAVPGRGDALVDAGTTPDRWIHRWGDLVERPAAPRMDDALALDVAHETRRIAHAFGGPLDIEWVHDGAQLHVVQARPITGLERIGVFSNRIAREVLPGLIHPLVWSVNIPVVNGAWVDLITQAIGPNDIEPDRLARSFAFRAYFDMGALGEVFVALGMPRDSLELLLGLPGGSERPRFRPTAATWRHLPRMLRLAWRLDRYDQRLARELPRLARTLDALAADDLASMTDAALLARVDRLMAVSRRAAYANIVTPLLMNAYGALVRRRATALGLDAARVDVTRGHPEAEAHDPRQAILDLTAAAAALPDDDLSSVRAGGYAALGGNAALDALRVQVDEFLVRFGHLGDRSTDISSRRWREDPDLVIRMALGHLADDAAGPAGPAVGAAPIGPEELVASARGPSRWILRRLVGRATAFKVWRDVVSDRYTFGFALFRGTFLELGQRLAARDRLAAADDIFLLTLTEVRAALNGEADAPDLRPLVAARRQEMAEAEELDLPETIIGDDFVPRRRSAAGSAVIRGVPSARGTYRGVARVVGRLADADRLRPGEVLVIPFSDVAWTPLFARAGAVIAESGGMLSHSSIVAREHGIPCVVSAVGALAIRDGSTVHVDGYNGIVSVEGPAEAAAEGDPGEPSPGAGD